MTGNEYKKLIGRYIVSAYGSRGLKVYDEVSLGTSIIGKQRRIDLFVVGPDSVGLAVECKYQDSSGTADEKIPYALNDMAAQRVAGVLVYAGSGFSEGVRHLLQGSEQAAYCLPDEQDLTPKPRKGGAMNSGTWQLDHALAQTFKLWDIILGAKQPMVIECAKAAEPEALPRTSRKSSPKASRLPKPATAPAELVEASKRAGEAAAKPAKKTSAVKTKSPPNATRAAKPLVPAPARDLAQDEPLLQMVNLIPQPGVAKKAATETPENANGRPTLAARRAAPRRKSPAK